jgi:hypothetical protein
MKGNATTARRRQSLRNRSVGHSTDGGDRLTPLRDRELVDLIDELDGAYDTLLAKALNEDGNNGCYELAATVRTATDYLINMRLSATR